MKQSKNVKSRLSAQRFPSSPRDRNKGVIIGRVQEEAEQPLQEDELCIPEPVEYEESSDDVYCVCQEAYNTDAAMISCDSCEEWFHCRCVGVAPSTARTIKKYTCPICQAVKGNFDELAEAMQRTQRTR